MDENAIISWSLRQFDKMSDYIEDLQNQIDYLKTKIAILEEANIKNDKEKLNE